MFPKKDEKIPEIRFNGFTDDWEQRKLGEYTSLITKGTTPKNKTGIGEVNFVKVENLIDKKIYPVQHITNEEHENHLKRSQLKENDILFSIAGTLGRTAIVDKSVLPANTNQALSIIRGFSWDINFLITYLSGPAVLNYIRKNPTVGAQPNLSLKQISDLDIVGPKQLEQSQLGILFKIVDNLITLHQRKLDALQEHKKGLLQKMFV
nr:restriction endonuclease subunit S [Fructobacillus tropaeoli]